MKTYTELRNQAQTGAQMHGFTHSKLESRVMSLQAVIQEQLLLLCFNLSEEEDQQMYGALRRC